MPKTITFVNNGNGTHTMTMTWTADSDKMMNLGADAGEYFYYIHWPLFDVDGNLIPWDNLTNQQKLDVLLKECTLVMRKGAYSGYTSDTVETAKEGMESEDERYGENE